MEFTKLKSQKSKQKRFKVLRLISPVNNLPRTLERKISCGKYTCRLQYGMTDSLGADLAFIADNDLNSFYNLPVKQPQQLWAFRLKEPYTHFTRPNIFRWDGFFNYSACYNLKSDGSAFMFRSTMIKLEHPTSINFDRKFNTGKLKQVLWFVSHCKFGNLTAWSGRAEYVLELSKYIPIDIYTKHEMCVEQFGSLIKNDDNEEPELKDYHFYLSFENSLCKDYISEKLWKVLNSQGLTIPVTLGGLSIEEYESVAPPNSFIHVKNFTSPKALADHLKFVRNNSKAINYYHQWRNEYQLATTTSLHIGGNI